MSEETLEPAFDIFSGSMDRYAIWIESVRGLAKARERMEEIAARKPGTYFLFSSQSHTILALIDNAPAPESAEAPERNKNIA